MGFLDLLPTQEIVIPNVASPCKDQRVDRWFYAYTACRSHTPKKNDTYGDTTFLSNQRRIYYLPKIRKLQPFVLCGHVTAVFCS